MARVHRVGAAFSRETDAISRRNGHTAAMPFTHWASRLKNSALPAYQLIPDLIAEDLRQGRLAPRERLPPLRELAGMLQLNYTTVVRGFAEARERGLIASRPGLGSYVRGSFLGLPLRAGTGAEMTMNMPPEIDGHPAMQRMKETAAEVMGAAAMHDLMRYQDFGGTLRDRELGARWLAQWVPDARADRTLVAPGIHSVLLGLVSMLVKPGQSLCVEAMVYPGLKAIAAQLGTQLHPISMDEDGLLPDEFESACKSTPVGALYLCPNLHNPMCATLPMARRERIADIALRFNVPIIEDDAYGMLPAAIPPALADFAPELTYYVSGMSKWLGAGVRTAYVLAPSATACQRVAGAMRATTVMASPLINLMVSAWLESGLAGEVLDAIRAECRWRSSLLAHKLVGHGVRTHPQGFHAWLPLPESADGSSRASDLAARLRELGVAAVAGNAFCTDRLPPEGLRICLGGSLNREDCGRAISAVIDSI
ncbi:PLP-dependent aminotransferase family protein [Xylophilus sp. GOD-11R]|uniref:aminotransferase-like domain-containing protein n=1 Tax=Xylophilus sp. GOD-11R TaxID=3089814 RepID=UPI00298BED27|nr:PLP-dependent aminotransferase family protein [Xylophilus sp. GOD-11R]WPB55601.1 PLP-dependent aminotransferase family protein [Xylophilus sp. GOD-11R]